MRVVRNFILAALCVSNNLAAAQPQSLSRSRFIEVEVYRDRGLSRSLMPQIPTHAAQFRTRPECYNLASKLFCAGRRQVLSRPVAHVGEWLSLVEHLVRDQGVGGSNPLSPTNSTNYKFSNDSEGLWIHGRRSMYEEFFEQVRKISQR